MKIERKVLSEADIEEINNDPSIDGWREGIFTQPTYIPVHIKTPVIYQRYETGGVSGGSCWEDSDPQPYSVDERPPFKVLDLVLRKICPDISYLKYREIEGLIHTNSESEYEYYGNSTDWEVKYIILEDLYKLL